MYYPTLEFAAFKWLISCNTACGIPHTKNQRWFPQEWKKWQYILVISCNISSIFDSLYTIFICLKLICCQANKMGNKEGVVANQFANNMCDLVGMANKHNNK